MNIKYKKVVYCPHCNGVAVIYRTIFLKKINAHLPRYQCTGCGKTFHKDVRTKDVCPTCTRAF